VCLSSRLPRLPLLVLPYKLSRHRYVAGPNQRRDDRLRQRERTPIIVDPARSAPPSSVSERRQRGLRKSKSSIHDHVPSICYHTPLETIVFTP